MEDSTPQHSPSEGWSLWYSESKFSNLSQKKLIVLFSSLFTQYWKQDSKLKDTFDLMDWEACGGFMCDVVINSTGRLILQNGLQISYQW